MLVLTLSDGKVWKLASDLTTWNEFSAGTSSASSVAWTDITGRPATFTPASHSQAWSTITSTPSTLSGYGITDAVGSSDSRLTDSRTPTSHVHGNINNAGAIGSTSGQIVVTTINGVLTTAATIASTAVSGLPTAGTASTNYCAGNDSRLSDSRSPTSHASTHASGGADAISIAASQVSGLAAVATSGNYSSLTSLPTLGTAASSSTSDFAAASHTHALSALTQSSAASGQVATWNGTAWAPATPTPATTSASSLTSGTLSDSLLSSNVVTVANLTARFNQSTSVVDVIDRAMVTTTRGPTTGTIFFSFFSPASSVTVSSISMATGAGLASSVTLARMGLYTWDGSTLTLVARTASDTTLFTSSATVFLRSFDTSGSYPSTYTLAAGTRYAVAVIVVASSIPLLLAGNAPNTIAGLTPRVQAARNGATDLQTSVSTFQATADTIIWARLS